LPASVDGSCIALACRASSSKNPKHVSKHPLHRNGIAPPTSTPAMRRSHVNRSAACLAKNRPLCSGFPHPPEPCDGLRPRFRGSGGIPLDLKTPGTFSVNTSRTFSGTFQTSERGTP
jgi:hypothetical protein